MAPIKVEAANCLKHLTDVFHLKHNESVCYLAALMQLNIAEAASTDFDELIMAYSSIIQVGLRERAASRIDYVFTQALFVCRVYLSLDSMVSPCVPLCACLLGL